MSPEDRRVTARKPARRRRDLSGFDDSVGRKAPIVEVTVELVDASDEEAQSESSDDLSETGTPGRVVDVRLVLPPGQ